MNKRCCNCIHWGAWARGVESCGLDIGHDPGDEWCSKGAPRDKAAAGPIAEVWLETEEEVSRLREQNETLRAACEAAEWMGEKHRWSRDSTCPVCFGSKPHGHRSGCILAAALKETP